jgi:GNAT superfamily N-acetyltransferase
MDPSIHRVGTNMQLQIIRTRHPPEAYFPQFVELISEEGKPCTVADFQRRVDELQREDRLLIGLDGEQLVGFAHLRVSRDLLFEETAELVHIIVKREFRRQGIGTRIIHAAETWAEQSGRARLLLRTDVVRTDAHAFFVALGYEKQTTSIDFVKDLALRRSSEALTQPY